MSALAPLFDWFPNLCHSPRCHKENGHFHPGNYVRIRQVTKEAVSIEALTVDSNLTQYIFHYQTSLFASIPYCLEVLERNPSLVDWYRKIVLPMIRKDAIELEEISHGI
jgi:hypothetical protein